MRKEEILEVLKKCNIQNYYSITSTLLAVVCEEITWKELEIITKDIVDIREQSGFIRIAIEMG